jgi:hypothetical protein
MTEGESTPALQFKPVGICGNPMEVEIYPATLREKEIPHRTEWDPDGRLVLMVPDEWRNAAVDALAQAAKLFFGESFKPADGRTPAPDGGCRAGGMRGAASALAVTHPGGGRRRR